MKTGDDTVHPDMELATQVARGQAPAVAQFCERYKDDLDRAARRIRSVDEADEWRQRLLVRILVGSADTPAKILSYRGQSSLRSWVRAVATRFAIDIHRAAQRRPPPAAWNDRLVTDSARMQRKVDERDYAKDVRQAVHAAFGELTPRQRNLLRHAVFHGLSVGELGAVYSVHRATAARWLQSARVELAERVTKKVTVLTGASEHEVQSILHELRSAADVSLRSLLPHAFESEA